MAKPFEILLTEMRNGRVVEQLTDAWGELIDAVRHTSKPGSMTVTFSVKPSGENGMEISTKVATKEPKPDVGTSFFFIDADGNLTRSDTRQRTFFDEGVSRIPERVMATSGE